MSCSRCSISKQRGAEMSSRLMPPKPGAIAVDGRDDLVGVGGRQADRPRVDAAELLEQHRLALHHGHRRLRADVAEPEHGGAVADDRDRVVLDRQVPDLARVLGDRRRRRAPRPACRPSRGRRGSSAAPSSTISILPPRCSRKVRSETCSTSTPVERCAPPRRSRSMCSASRRRPSRRAPSAPLDTDEVDRAESAAGVGDRPRELRKCSGPVVQMDAKRGAERRRRVSVIHFCMLAEIRQKRRDLGCRAGDDERMCAGSQPAQERTSSPGGSEMQPFVGWPRSTCRKIAEPRPGTRVRVVLDEREVRVARSSTSRAPRSAAERRRRSAGDVLEGVVGRRAPDPRPTSRRRRAGGRGSARPDPARCRR